MGNITMRLSSDEKLLELTIEQTQLTAIDVETIISHLANQRQNMAPQVNQSGLIEQSSHHPIDAMLPNLDLAVRQQDPPLIVLAIAFEGLGVRSVAISMEQAKALRQSLGNAIESLS